MNLAGNNNVRRVFNTFLKQTHASLLAPQPQLATQEGKSNNKKKLASFKIHKVPQHV